MDSTDLFLLNTLRASRFLSQSFEMICILLILEISRKQIFSRRNGVGTDYKDNGCADYNSITSDCLKLACLAHSIYAVPVMDFMGGARGVDAPLK